MNLSTNFKVALLSIFVVGLVLLGSVLYATQVVTTDGVKSQMGIYQQALQLQVHNLSARMATIEKNIISGSVLFQETKTTSTVMTSTPATKK